MIEPIDFSQRDNETLPLDLIQRVLALALLWTVVVGALSGWFFLRKTVGPASALLDRRQAEGRPMQSSPPSSSSFGGLGPGAGLPQIRGVAGDGQEYRRPKKRLAALPEKAPESRASPEVGTWPTPDRGLAAVAGARSEPVASQRSGRDPVRPIQAASRPSEAPRPSLAPGRLLYPVSGDRPSPTDLAEVVRRVESSLIRIVTWEEQPQVGLRIDGSGRCVIASSFLGRGSTDRILTAQGTHSGRQVGQDAEYGLALLQLSSGASGVELPLAPSPPQRGESLVAFRASISGCAPLEVWAGSEFAPAGFLVEGALGPNTLGSPLFNRRGEVTGFHVASLPSFPGGGVHLAADSAAIARLLRGYQLHDGYASAALEQQALQRLASLASEESHSDKARANRIVPQAGLSFFSLGMRRSEAEARLSSPRKRPALSGVEIWSSEAPPLELIFVHDRLVAASTSYVGFATETGLSVGARIDRPLLNRTFESCLWDQGLAVVPGLEILLDRDGSARQFVVRPRL